MWSVKRAFYPINKRTSSKLITLHLKRPIHSRTRRSRGGGQLLRSPLYKVIATPSIAWTAPLKTRIHQLCARDYLYLFYLPRFCPALVTWPLDLVQIDFSAMDPSKDAGPTTASAGDNAPDERSSPTAAQFSQARARTSTNSSFSAASGRLRSASIKILQADVPLGFLSGSANAVSQAPTLSDIRRGTFHHDDGWNHERYAEHHAARRASNASSTGERKMSRTGSGLSIATLGGRKRENTLNGNQESGLGKVDEQPQVVKDGPVPVQREIDSLALEERGTSSTEGHPHRYPNGYEFPPKLPWTTSTKIGLIAFWKWFLTPFGFLLTLYGLNVVAWGGMLFLLLIGGGKAYMCHPTCNDINSARRIWIEYDSQIVNALFCVTGFGLIPWRFRDLYWLMVFRLGIRGRGKEERQKGIRMLAGIHRSWFRLQGSDNWTKEGNPDEDEQNPSVPLPITKKLGPPLTGFRAPPTALWRMDFVIWMNCWNTFLQAVLCGFMWGLNR